MITTHYAQPLDGTLDRLAAAAASLHRFYTVGIQALGLAHQADISAIPEINSGRPSEGLLEHLMDDLNTPAALSHLFSLAKQADQTGSHRQAVAKQLLIDSRFLGIDPFRYIREEEAAFKSHRKIEDGPIINLIDARNTARKTKNFQEADRIRDELNKMGIELEDRRDGTTIWRLKR